MTRPCAATTGRAASHATPASASRRDAAEVFDLFTQERQALDRAQGGLGLGLTIVRSLVELHGGTIEAHSDGLGKGSEFVIRFPGAEMRQRTRGATRPGSAHVRRTDRPPHSRRRRQRRRGAVDGGGARGGRA